MRLHGKAAEIWVNGSKLTTGTQWEIDAEGEYADNTVYGDTGKTYLRGLFAVNVRFSGLLDVGAAPLQAAMAAGLVAVLLKADSGTTIASGNGWVDAGASADVHDAERMRGTIKGSGGWALNY